MAGSDSETSALKRVGEILGVVTQAVVLLGVVGFIALVCLELRRDTLGIAPFETPPPMQAMGYSPQVAMRRFRSATDRVIDAATTAYLPEGRLPLQLMEPNSERIDFEAPALGLSLAMTVSAVRRTIGSPEPRLEGEFVCAAPGCADGRVALELRLLVDGSWRTLTSPPVLASAPAALDGYLEAAAAGVLEHRLPVVAASYHLRAGDAAAAERIAARVAEGPREERKWGENLLGILRFDEGDPEGARAHYERALALDPGFAVAANNLALLALATGDAKEAARRIDAAVAARPAYPAAHVNAAYIRAVLGDFDRALESAREAARLDPDGAEAQLAIAGVLGQRGVAAATTGGDASADFAAAERAYGDALLRDPGNVMAEAGVAQLHALRQDHEAAVAIYERIAARGEPPPVVLAAWAASLVELGDRDAAAEKLRALLCARGAPASGFARGALEQARASGLALARQAGLCGALPGACGC